MAWWDEAGAVVESCECDHYRDECPTNRTYGPHRRLIPDRTGHQHLRTEIIKPAEHPNGWPVVVCECGWRGFPTDRYEHVAKAAAGRVEEILS